MAFLIFKLWDIHVKLGNPLHIKFELKEKYNQCGYNEKGYQM